MNKHTLHLTAQRVFNSLPPSFQQAFLDHKHPDDVDDFLDELALAWLEGRTPAQARASVRRFAEGGQGPRGVESLQAWMEKNESHELDVFFSPSENENKTGDGEIEISLDGIPTSTKEIARQHGVTRRRAQQILKEQIARAQLCGDLFLNLKTETPLMAGRREGQVENPERKINQASVAGRPSKGKAREGWA